MITDGTQQSPQVNCPTFSNSLIDGTLHPLPCNLSWFNWSVSLFGASVTWSTNNQGLDRHMLLHTTMVKVVKSRKQFSFSLKKVCKSKVSKILPNHGVVIIKNSYISRFAKRFSAWPILDLTRFYETGTFFTTSWNQKKNFSANDYFDFSA